MENISEVFYSGGQVERVAQSLGLVIASETRHDLLCMCPYHSNNVTPSFSLSKSSGQFICFNGSCNKKGDLVKLVQDIKHIAYFPALRFIAGAEPKPGEIAKEIQSRIDHSDELPTFRQEVVDRMHEDLQKNAEAKRYLAKRGIKKESVETFELGYSEQGAGRGKSHLIAIPMHDINGNLVGVIGRDIREKKFKNSKRLPGSRTLWNIHRAKASNRVVIVESAFDAIRLWQLGFASVAILSGSLSESHVKQLGRYFDHVIIMSDDDDFKYYPSCQRCHKDGRKSCIGHSPGRELGRKIETELLDLGAGIRVEWAVGSAPGHKLYDRGAKDAGDMTDDEIAFAVRNAWSVHDFRLIDSR